MPVDLTVIGVGNLLMGDDGVAPRIIERLSREPAAAAGGGIEYLDGGVGGLRLINWIEQASRLLLVDAADFGGRCGQLRLVPPDRVCQSARAERFSLHETGLAQVLDLAGRFFRRPPTWLLGIQVVRVAPSDALSVDLEDAMDRLVEAVRRLALRLRRVVV
jgi:hydrogenase maturation protease